MNDEEKKMFDSYGHLWKVGAVLYKAILLADNHEWIIAKGENRKKVESAYQYEKANPSYSKETIAMVIEYDDEDGYLIDEEMIGSEDIEREESNND